MTRLTITYTLQEGDSIVTKSASVDVDESDVAAVLTTETEKRLCEILRNARWTSKE